MFLIDDIVGWILIIILVIFIVRYVKARYFDKVFEMNIPYFGTLKFPMAPMETPISGLNANGINTNGASDVAMTSNGEVVVTNAESFRNGKMRY